MGSPPRLALAREGKKKRERPHRPLANREQVERARPFTGRLERYFQTHRPPFGVLDLDVGHRLGAEKPLGVMSESRTQARQSLAQTAARLGVDVVQEHTQLVHRRGGLRALGA